MKTYNEISIDIKSKVRYLIYSILIELGAMFYNIGIAIMKLSLRFSDYD